MPNVVLDSTTADEHVLLLADLYWDWDEDTATGSASLDELKEAGAYVDPTTGKWTVPLP